MYAHATFPLSKQSKPWSEGHLVKIVLRKLSKRAHACVIRVTCQGNDSVKWKPTMFIDATHNSSNFSRWSRTKRQVAWADCVFSRITTLIRNNQLMLLRINGVFVRIQPTPHSRITDLLLLYRTKNSSSGSNLQMSSLLFDGFRKQTSDRINEKERTKVQRNVSSSSFLGVSVFVPTIFSCDRAEWTALFIALIDKTVL